MKVSVIGFEFAEGISKKTNKPYSIGKLYTGCKLDGDNARGSMGTEYQLDVEVIKSIFHLPLPFEADLEVEDVMRFGERRSKVMTVTPIARVEPASLKKAA